MPGLAPTGVIFAPFFLIDRIAHSWHHNGLFGLSLPGTGVASCIFCRFCASHSLSHLAPHASPCIQQQIRRVVLPLCRALAFNRPDLGASATDPTTRNLIPVLWLINRLTAFTVCFDNLCALAGMLPAGFQNALMAQPSSVEVYSMPLSKLTVNSKTWAGPFPPPLACCWRCRISWLKTLLRPYAASEANSCGLAT